MPSYLPAGSALTSWLINGPRFDASRRPALWIYRWKGYWFDRNWGLQERLYPSPDFDRDGGTGLIFVLGFWRSGTTLLHELLSSGPHMAAPRTWQCMNPSAFRIGNPPRSGTSISRPMDAVVVNALSPQEDEFALLARGAPSVYRAWLDPRRWEEVLPALSHETWTSLAPREWFHDWRTFLGWCIPDGATTLVVKSPNHVYRLRALLRIWPGLRMVWTLRDPVEAWLSNRKMWHAMTRVYGLSEWEPTNLDRLLFNAFQEYSKMLRWAADTIGPRQLTVVDFDQLTRSTAEVLPTLTMRLKLGVWEQWMPRIGERLRQSADYRRQTNRTTAPLPEYGRSLIEEIRELHDQLLKSERSVSVPG